MLKLLTTTKINNMQANLISPDRFNSNTLKSGENFYRGFIVKPSDDFGFRQQGITGFVVTDAHNCNPMPGACGFKTLAQALDGIDVFLHATEPEHFWEIMQPTTGYEVGKLAPGNRRMSEMFGGSVITSGRRSITVDADSIVTQIKLTSRRPWDGKPEMTRPHKLQ